MGIKERINVGLMLIRIRSVLDIAYRGPPESQFTCSIVVKIVPYYVHI